MKSIVRYDNFELPKVSVTDDGFLQGEAVVSRAGVFELYG